jgi:membrane-associated phospholipid phosphatase
LTAATASPVPLRRAPHLAAVAAALIVVGTVTGRIITDTWPGTLFLRLDDRTKAFLLDHQRDDLRAALLRLTDLGDRSVAWVPAVLGGLVLAALWRRWWPLATCVVAYAGALVVTAAVKFLVARGDPELTGLERIAHYQFPSGHTVVATSVYLTITLLVAAWVRTPVAKVLTLAVGITPVFAVAASRVYLGYHWLTDAVAALVLGGCWVAAVCWPLRPVLGLRRPARDVAPLGDAEGAVQDASDHQDAVAASASAGGVNDRQPR